MKNFIDNNRVDALVTILVFSVGAISIVVTAQFGMGQDGNALKNLLGGCIYGACKDTKITGNLTNGTLAGCIYGACKNIEIRNNEPTPKPTPTTGTLIVTKIKDCNGGSRCDEVFLRDFRIAVTGNNPSPATIGGSGPPGTEVILGPGDYKVDERDRCGVGSQFVCIVLTNLFVFEPTFSTDCAGTITAGETKQCVITNTFISGP